MIKLLSLILLVLLTIIGGKRGIKTFFTIYMNLALLFILVIIVGWGFNPTIPTLVICTIISIIILFFLNGYNKKTISSFISVIITLIVFTIITFVLSNNIYIHGYPEETIESISYLTYNIGINMLPLSSCIIIIGLIGTINDTSIAISSALYELHENNPKLKVKELFLSGMNIGRDILGTTTNTLFFAYLGGFMTLFIYFQDFQYSFSTIMNSKVFAIEFTRIILSGISSFLIIPLTSLITSVICKYDKEDIYEKIKYYLRRQRTTSSRKRISSTNNSNRKKRIKNSI
jgi:uncharacterized membrane protein